jgi:7-carboxy-7-deazaguanine synthase
MTKTPTTPTTSLSILNSQPAERPAEPGADFEIVDVWETLQGEGPMLGRPATFIRTAGCNLQCPLCDTDYTTNRRAVSAEVLIEEIEKSRNGVKFPANWLIVFTGGEVFRQPHMQLAYVLCKLQAHFTKKDIDLTIQIETNGSLEISEHLSTILRALEVLIIISPKGRIKTFWYDPEWRELVYFKYIGGQVSSYDEKIGLPGSALGRLAAVSLPSGYAVMNNRVFLQPTDYHNEAESEASRQAAVAACIKNGWRYTPQIHKQLGLK